MDDYISKPVRKKELKEKIYHWIKDTKVYTNSYVTPPVETSGSQIILDEDLLDEARDVMKGKFEFMLTCFIEDVEMYLQDIHTAVANRDIAGIVRPAHTIKSSSKRLGALSLSEKAKNIEIAAREAANNNDTMIWNQSEFLSDLESIGRIFAETCNKLKTAA